MPPKLTRVIRLDSLPLNQTYFTEEGYLIDRPILTSTGIFEYKNPDGSVRRELRLAEEVFDKESLASYKGRPIIITHDAGLVNKDNVQDHHVGTILTEGYRSGTDVRAEIVIHDTTALKRSGLRELSLGYNLDLDETPGEWEGQPYDAIQRNIRINHLALVKNARAGEQARLNIDGRDPQNNSEGGNEMSFPNNTQGAVPAAPAAAPAGQPEKNDSILSPEKLDKAIAEYKARRAQANHAAKDSEDKPAAAPGAGVPPKAVPPTNPATPTADADDIADAPKTPEEKLEQVKQNRDSAKAEGEPADLDTAKGRIAKMDADMDTLMDIIDTLLAQKDFDGTDCDPDKNEDEDDATDEEVQEDSDDEDVLADVDEPAKHDENQKIPTVTAPAKPNTTAMNADSIDAIVRQRVQIGMMGRALNMDGLESMNIRESKIAIIKAVRPSVHLDGKSDAYINAAYDLAVADVNRRSGNPVQKQKRQMFNKDHADALANKGAGGSRSARERMIARQQNKTT